MTTTNTTTVSDLSPQHAYEVRLNLTAVHTDGGTKWYLDSRGFKYYRALNEGSEATVTIIDGSMTFGDFTVYSDPVEVAACEVPPSVRDILHDKILTMLGEVARHVEMETHYIREHKQTWVYPADYWR